MIDILSSPGKLPVLVGDLADMGRVRGLLAEEQGRTVLLYAAGRRAERLMRLPLPPEVEDVPVEPGAFIAVALAPSGQILWAYSCATDRDDLWLYGELDGCPADRKATGVLLRFNPPEIRRLVERMVAEDARIGSFADDGMQVLEEDIAAALAATEPPRVTMHRFRLVESGEDETP